MSVKYIEYNTDTGNRDSKEVGCKDKFSKAHNYTLECVLHEAIKMNAYVVVETFPYKNKPGGFYIKGFKTKISYEDITKRLENNLNQGLYKTRKSYLIKY